MGTKPSGGIWEQLDNGDSGLIVEATADGLFEGIRTLLNDKKLRLSMGEKLGKKNFEGTGEIRKFLEFLDM